MTTTHTLAIGVKRFVDDKEVCGWWEYQPLKGDINKQKEFLIDFLKRLESYEELESF